MTDPGAIARCHIYEALRARGIISRAPRAAQFYRPPSPLTRGMGADLLTRLITVAGEAIAIPKGAPSPGQMYAEAAPRVQRMLKQYDEAAPKIDWVNANWPTLAITLLVGGALAVIGGNYAYDLVRGRK